MARRNSRAVVGSALVAVGSRRVIRSESSTTPPTPATAWRRAYSLWKEHGEILALARRRLAHHDRRVQPEDVAEAIFERAADGKYSESIVEPRPLLRSAGSSCSLRGAEDNRVADRMGAGNNFTIARDELVHAEACPLCRHERMKVGLVTPLELVMHRRAVQR
jgi:hypothetical protein